MNVRGHFLDKVRNPKSRLYHEWILHIKNSQSSTYHAKPKQ